MANAVITPRTLTATVIAVATPERMKETSAVLSALRSRSAVRTILVSLGENRQPEVRSDADAITINGLLPRYLNNAVASLRLSSLPAIAWWRGGEVAVLTDLADLVDRLVLDAEDPAETWRAAPRVAELTAVSDLRWTRLTRWRSLMAQFFDVPDVRSAGGSFSSLEIGGSDPHAARLFAAWLRSRLRSGAALAVTIDAAGRDRAALRSVTLTNERVRLSLALMEHSNCIETSIKSSGGTLGSRVVPLGDQGLEALMGEELRVRARDEAFEEALRAAGELS